MRLRVYQVDFKRDGPNWIAEKGRYSVRILPDDKYPTMWRIEHPRTKAISGMVNLIRAKDAALGLIESLEFVSAPPAKNGPLILPKPRQARFEGVGATPMAPPKK